MGTKLVFYRELDGGSSIVEWLRELRSRDQRGYEKCSAAIRQLAVFGHELRRPTAAYPADGIHELRVRAGHVNYRLLYFFHGQGVAVLVHAVKKERVIPMPDMRRALRRKQAFELSPDSHTFME